MVGGVGSGANFDDCVFVWRVIYSLTSHVFVL